MDTEKLISEILSRPALWMSKHPQHKFRNIIKKLWDEIKEQFPGSTDENLKKKWKNLKDCYRKELKKIPTCRSGDEGSDYQSQWKYFEMLSFLKDEYLPDVGESNLIEEETSSIIESIEESSPSSPPPQLISSMPSRPTSPGSPIQQAPIAHSSRHQIPSSQTTTQNVSETQKSSRKRLKATEIRSEYLEIEKKKLKLLEADLASSKEKDTPKSDDYHFLMSLLPEMVKLYVLQKMRLRTKFTQALMEEISYNQYPGYYTQPSSSDYSNYNNNS